MIEIDAVELLHAAYGHLPPESIANALVAADLDAMAATIRAIREDGRCQALAEIEAARLADEEAFLEWSPLITEICSVDRHHTHQWDLEALFAEFDAEDAKVHASAHAAWRQWKQHNQNRTTAA